LEQNRRHRARAAIAPAAAVARRQQKREPPQSFSPSLCRQSNTFNSIITITMTRRLARIASA
jgi:hypothetical protein